MCLDFAMAAAEIESSAARLLQARSHLLALGDARGEFADAFADYVALFDGEVEPCVSEAVMAANDRVSATGQRVADDTLVVDELLGAIGLVP
jgi:hypothetical protein